MKLKQLSILVLVPLSMGAKGDGCASNSNSPAPETSGAWAIAYDDNLQVDITIGGATYTEEIGPQGGAIEITHNGQPIEFDLDCSREEVLCPSEAWPEAITIEQRNQQKQHRMIVTLPIQQCDGTLNEPPANECGPGTNNEECDAVCDGEITVINRERFGVIGETGESFRLFLGAGIATNGFNCALFAASVADADLVTTGSADNGDWEAISMENGTVNTIYTGGCLWAGDPDMDMELEALVLAASVRISTGFTGARQ